jgi:hypothetical protein
MRTRPTAPAPALYEYHYRWSGAESVRIWKPTWYGDQFEVLNSNQFETLKAIAPGLGLHLVEHED